MVIHDMRNPTNSITYALKKLVEILQLDQNIGETNKKKIW